MGKVVDTEYFKKNNIKPSEEPPAVSQPDNAGDIAKAVVPDAVVTEAAAAAAANDGKPEIPTVTAGRGLTECIRTIVADIKEKGCREDADDISRIYGDAVRERFCIAVVGEFSRGKSTFVNKFLGRDIVCSGNLPTTSMLTHIRYSKNEKIMILGKDRKPRRVLPADISSWEGHLASDSGNDATENTAIVGLNIPMLKKYSLEIIDTPGAGDLDESRMKAVGQMLLGCDGAIVAISATAPLSMSEKLFIEERLLTRKTPYLMLIVTKLDQIPVGERARVIRFIKEKLSLWKVDIPIYVPADVEVPDGEYDDIVGIGQVRKAVAEWVCDPERKRLTNEWIADRTAFVLKSRVSLLNEELLLAQSDKGEQEKLIKEKRQKITEAENYWEDLKLKMLSNCNFCCEMINDKTDEYVRMITERLQYELSHAPSPQKWWEEDYPYRLKIELTNMAVSLDKAVTAQITQDAAWFNNALEKSFKTHILGKKTTIVDKERFEDPEIRSRPELDDLEKHRTIARVGTVALSVAGALVCATMGFTPLVATMGIGTGAGIVNEKVFKKKIDQQRESIRLAIQRSIPITISDSISESVDRIREVYDDMIERASKREEEWLHNQKQMLETASKPADNEKAKSIKEQTALYSGLLEKLMRCDLQDNN